MQRTGTSAAARRWRSARPDDPPGTMQVAVVSGGSRGLGAALVTGLLERRLPRGDLQPVEDPFVDRDVRNRKRRGGFHWASVDGRDHRAWRAFVKVACERLGRIDVLVNNAGIAAEGILPTMRPSDIVEAVEVNLTACLVLAQACSRRCCGRAPAASSTYPR